MNIFGLVLIILVYGLWLIGHIKSTGDFNYEKELFNIFYVNLIFGFVLGLFIGLMIMKITINAIF